MKKMLYLIPLFIFLFILSPKDVLAVTEYKGIVLDSPITEEQKQEYLDYIFNSSDFTQLSNSHKYYLILYQKAANSLIFNYQHNGYIFVLFYDDFTSLSFTSSNALNLKFPSVGNYITFNTNNDMAVSSSGTGISSVDLIKSGSYDSNLITLNIGINYILSTNLEYSFNFDIPLYDSSDNYVDTIVAGENIFASLNSKPEEKVEPVIDSILNSEDKLYSLSKELLGELPEEFTFLYSLVQLFLGIVILLVALAPLIILLRFFR